VTTVPPPPADVDSPRLGALFFAVALLVVAALHYLGIPMTIWEYDEPLFAMAVEKYEPLIHQPPPPGYPLYIGFAKLLRPLFPGPFNTLLWISVGATLAGFLAFFAAFRAVSRSTRAAAFGAFLFYMSPAMLVHATLPQSDSGALALFALAMWLTVRTVDHPTTLNATLMALACAVTIGWRLQFCIAVVPMFLVGMLLLRSWRERFVALQWFAIACAAWLIPLVILTGGPEMFWKWMSGQAAYFAEHDADISRSGRTGVQIALRFIAHPWGPKLLAAPVLLLAVIGLVDAFRRRARAILPIVVMVVVYLGFALVMMDPADGVRYALPSVPGVAVLAVMGLEWLRRLTRGLLVDWALLALYALGAFLYCGSLLRERATVPSPPVAAITHLRAIAPRNAVILYDMPLKPHAIYMLRGFTRTRVDEGLLRFGHRTDVPLYQLTDSATVAEDGAVFNWPTGDAYHKLTRGHYGATSIVPLPVTQRFQAVAGISPPERTATGSWRWIGEKGVILLPDLGRSHAKLTFATPADYPFDSIALTVLVNDRPAASVNVKRGATVPVVLPLSPGRTKINIEPARYFIPSKLPGSMSRDPRKLSVMLMGLEQFNAAAAQTAAQAIAQ
jgi:hypothetical protein